MSDEDTVPESETEDDEAVISRPTALPPLPAWRPPEATTTPATAAAGSGGSGGGGGGAAAGAGLKRPRTVGQQAWTPACDSALLAAIARLGPAPRGQPQHGEHLPAHKFWSAVARGASGDRRSAVAVWARWRDYLRPNGRKAAAAPASPSEGEEEEEVEEEEVEEEEVEEEEVSAESSEAEEVGGGGGGGGGKSKNSWSATEVAGLREFLRAQRRPHPSLPSKLGWAFWGRAAAAVAAASGAPMRGVYACLKRARL
jgi:hypothetical protein